MEGGIKDPYALEIHNKIALVRNFPGLADYRVLQAQPAFWLGSMINLLMAEEDIRKANGGTGDQNIRPGSF